ncbi:MAG TPA: hypothetical protein DDY14_10025 [Chromatiaceae bacterium]|nr:hypothetical protein [Chromatiaceae bacterium]HCS92161.1 hypothetical protein [Chromatiaceae bacterium]
MDGGMQVNRLDLGPSLDEQIIVPADPTLGARADAPPLVPVFPNTAENPDVVLYQTLQGGFEVRWHIDGMALERARDAFGNGADAPSSVLRLQQIDSQGARRIIADAPLEDQEMTSTGVARCPAVTATGLLQAEIGLSTKAGGWLLIARSNGLQATSSVGPAFLSESEDASVASSRPLAGESPMLAHMDQPSPPSPLQASIDPPDAAAAVGTSEDAGRDLAPQQTVDQLSGSEHSGFGELAWQPASPISVLPDATSDDRQPDARLPDVRAGQFVPSSTDDEQVIPAGARGNSDVIDQSGNGASAFAASPEPQVKVPAPGSGPVQGFCVDANGWMRAELVVHGNASPGALLDLGGHPYRVGPGGRFSFRVPLADRELIMRLLAMLPELPVQPRDSANEPGES